MKYVLWHPDSPGVRVLVRRPSLLRRLRINRSSFATLGECLNKHTSYVNWFTFDGGPEGAKDLTRPRR